MSENRYPVGRGRPPLHSRFPKGQSGNPSGRPKGVRNLQTETIKELLGRITVTENGRQIRISKQRLLIKKLVADAPAGT